MKSFRLFALFLMFAFTLLFAGTAFANQGNAGIAPISSRITTVKTYADLGAEWWQWAAQAPAADTPILDLTGENCRVGQEGAVWFLAGTLAAFDSVERSCEVPAGKALFFPVINAVYFGFLNDPPETRTAEYVRDAAEELCDRETISELSVTIDGKPVARAAEFATSADESPLFQAQLPTDNVFGLTEDIAEELVLSPAAHQGFYIYVKPLEPGEHTVEWTASWVCDFGAGPEVKSEDVAYTLTVLEGVSGQVE